MSPVRDVRPKVQEERGRPGFLRRDWEQKVAERARERARNSLLGRPSGDHAVLEQTRLARKINLAYRVRTLSEKQRKAVMMLADFTHDYTKRYIANQCGVTTMALWFWRNDPLFISELDKEITRRKTVFRPEAYKHLFRRIRRGQWSAIKDYFKMTGDLKHQITVENIEDMPKSLDQLDQEIQQLQTQLGSVELERETETA